MIQFLPDRFLKRVLPTTFFKNNILNKDMGLKAASVKALVTSTSLSKREVNDTVIKTVDIYEKKMLRLKQQGDHAYKRDALNGEKLLRNRLEGIALYAEVQNLKQEHADEWYEWLPSSSEIPDPEHQLLYGKIFRVGTGDKDGNMPCERYGCKCGIRFLTKNEVNNLKGN